MRQMHEIPPRIVPDSDSGYLEELTKAIFRCGFSWQVVRQKWDNFHESFDGFDVSKVAGYGDKDLSRLFNDASIVRNKRKIIAAIDNARTILGLVAEHGSVYAYLRSLDSLDYYRRMKLLTAQFSGLGRTGAFVFLHSVAEETPSWQDR